MSSSILSTYSFSIILDEQIGLKQSILGTITGAVIFGPIAGIVTNLAVPIVCGIIGGYISAIYFKNIFKKLNNAQIKDSLGLFNIGLIIPFLATFVITPIVLAFYYYLESQLPTLGNIVISSKNVLGWILMYIGISIGIGFGAGLITSLILKCDGIHI